MNACEKFIEKLIVELPEMCRVNDLIKYGIFSSPTDAREARTKGNSPDWFQCKTRGKILYPKAGVIEWLKEKIHHGQQKA